jgi:acyl transferase domain-containing protein/SAM-dependent methyltransferase
MDRETRNILELVQAGRISPEEGRRRLREAKSEAGQPAEAEPGAVPGRKVAIVGLAGRFAGARSARELWSNVAAGVCSVREVPAERWDAGRWYDPDPSVPGKTNCRWGGFVDDIDAFDPLFFNISGKEAELADPQQRLFLEACWSALEDAGYASDAVSGLRCGVFAGTPASEYGQTAEKDAQLLMGNDTAILAARISYLLNLKGPSLAINTACSSSLVALHLACQSIESGQCEMALAGGVCLFITPGFYVSAAKAGMLSPDGLCKTFDRDANGFVPGEGAGVVVLKELTAAERDGDHIYGVVAGVETNQDGKTNGITAPSSRAQTAVQLAAYRKAGISPETLSLIEAHGTGTQLGDPIEIEALSRSFAEHTGRKQFCAIGSVKTNIGHTGQAAGVAGLIKVLLALQHELIPPTLHFQAANERIRFAETPFFVATSPTPWPRRPGLPRRAAVSSFGYSGTNAHLVVEEPPARRPAAEDRLPRLVLVSAKTEEALARRLDDLAVWLEGEGRGQPLADIAFTLHAGRKHFTERAAFVASEVTELRGAIRRELAGGRPGLPRLLPGEKQQWAERLRKDLAEGEAGREILERAAELYRRGLDVEVDLVHPGGRGRRIPLPTYPFARERYWVSAEVAPPAEAAAGALRHPFLSEGLSTAAEHGYMFRPAGHEFFVADHVIEGRRVLAAAVALEMARAAGDHARPGVAQIREVTWRRPLPGQGGLEIRLRPEGGDLRFEIDEADQPLRAPSVTGLLRQGETGGEQEVVDLAALRGRCTGSLSGKACYERFRALGFAYGPGFRVIRELRFNATEVLARLELPALAAGPSGLVLHPSLLDGALQSMIALHSEDARADERLVPYAMAEVEVRAPLPRVCHACLVRRGETELDVRVTDEAGRVLVAIRGLTVARAAAPSGERLFFRPVWRPSPRPESTGAPGPILVLDGDGETAARLRAHLPGEAVAVAVPGPRFARVGPRDYEIDPASAEDYARLLEALAPEERPRRILVTWGAQAEPVPSEGVPDLTRGFSALLHLSQALMKIRRSGPVTLGYVYPVQGDLAPPHLAALGAFARTLRLENPDLRLQTIGLPADAAGTARVSACWRELLAEGEGSDAVELRFRDDGSRWVRGLDEVPRPDRAAPSLVREGGVYLITGGAGGLGLLLARHLARKQAKLVLIGRSALSAETRDALARLEADGASLVYERADAADCAALARAVESCRSRFGAIHGIIHAAGVLRDSFLLHKTPAEAREVITAKLDAAVWLDRITQADRLDFLVFFSSVVSVAGNVGQADYAFANAFLDELAAEREALRRAGKRWGRTLSIGWPAWAGGGMRGAAEAAAQRVGAGLAPLGDDEGLAVFEEALAWEGGHQLVVVKGDPVAVRQMLAPAGEAGVPASPARADRSDALRPAAEAYLREVLAEELRVPAARINVHEALEAYGIDSVMVMRLSRRLEADFGPLPKTLFFDYQNLSDLAGYFAERHGGRLAQKLTPVREDQAPVEPANISPVPRAIVETVSGGSGDSDAIAIVGISGRYPMAEDLDELWRNLRDGRDCVTEIPPDRWELDGFYSPERGTRGRSYSKWGGFLSDVDKFDTLFFNIAPNEADMMDPQERLFLETVWHLLEHAGITRGALKDRRTGVFVGVMYGQYQLLASDDGRLGVSSYASIANRVSYFFNFHGPSLALDTMCSSSLTAIHLACESLRRGECDVAVAGGVNVSIHPRKYLQLSLGGFASSDGRCRSFGEGGDGYVPGEGVGAVLLKPLAAAVADGDTIYGLVRGSAINHGGKTNGYTVPNPHAQSAVIVEALRRAKVDPRHVSYVEAHGTGTALGDPIEIAALTRAYGESPQPNGRCPVGSVKSGIGHLESAAGIAAVTKVLLQMRHATLAPSLHATELNPNIDFAGSPFFVQRELGRWERPAVEEEGRVRTLPRIAGVSSFGAGGANAHVLLEEYETLPPPALDDAPQLIVLSAKAEDRLAALAGRLADHLERHLAPSPGWRAALRDDLLRRVCQLAGVSEGEIGPGDELRECGFDEVACARLGTMAGEAYGIEWEEDLASESDNVSRIAERLAGRHEAGLRARFGGGETPEPAMPEPLRLADVAFTLQTGREAMAERLTFVARDLADAARRLRAFASGELVAGCFAGRAPAGQSEESLRDLVRDGELERVAQLWVQGADVDWRLLHVGHRRLRVALPGYPFARERHWLPVARPATSVPTFAEQETQMVAVTRQEGAAAAPAAGELRTQIVRDLVALAAEIIGLAPERMDPKVNFGEYGFESMALKALADRISGRFGVAFAPTLFFEHASLASVASWLLEEHEARMVAAYRPESRPAADAPPPPVRPAGHDAPRPEDEAPASSREPIAIIGMSGRFPGSRDLAQFWENLRAERDLITEIPPDRWDWREYDHNGLPPAERCKFHWGGFIDDVDKFDPLFFGISPAEAEMMDPQQRKFLEAVWEAIEDAGYRPSALSGKNVGLFAGVQFSDYQHLLHEAGILTAQSGLGNEHSIVLNRISYLLNLRGPSEPVNTACSSALVAVHRAVRSLRSGESSVAVAGGIALNLSPHSTVAAGMMGLLSPDGRCKTLDRSANGYVKGEGIGAIVLKPLRQALADGDHIYAVLRGTAVNHGGRAASLTAPSSEAQAILIQAAVEEAEVGPETIGYLELHGTGTELGDPVEINGIKSAFRKLAKKRGTPLPGRPHCGIGSVKTNIGHLEPASGIAGLIKVVLALQHEALPGVVHLQEVNPYVDLADSPFFIVDKTRPWDRLQDAAGRPLPRRAGVSSFGFGGVNAHVLLEEHVPPALSPPSQDNGPARAQVFVFSARTEEALDETVRRFLDRLDAWERDGAAPSLSDVAWTLQTGREEMKERLAVVARDARQLRERLEQRGAHVYRGQAPGGEGETIATTDPDLLAEHWARGGAVDWTLLHQDRRPRRVSLPTYPFARKRYWFTAPEGSARLSRPARTTAAPEPADSPEQDAEGEVLSGEDYVRAELREILAEKLKLSEEELEEDRDLQEFGVDSMLSAMIMQAAQEKFGSQLSLTAIADHPTLRSLAGYIYQESFAGQEQAEPQARRKKGRAGQGASGAPAAAASKQVKLPPELLPINMKGTRQASFWVHGAAGYSAWFQNLSDALGPEYPLYAFQARGTDGHSMPQMLDEMVDHYVHCIRLVQPKGPYVLGGYSFGGLIAMAMARRLHAEGETIRHLVMFDTYPATQDVFDRHFGKYDDDFLQFYLANYSLKIHENPELAIRHEDVAHLPKRLQLAELARLTKEKGNKRVSADDIYLYLRGGIACSEHSEGIYQMYPMTPYTASDVLYFKATDGFTGRASAMYWRSMRILDGYDYIQPWRDIVKGNVRVVELDNDHLNMLEEPTLTPAAREIETLLKQAPPLDTSRYSRFQEGFTEVTRFGHQLLADRFRRSGALPAAPESLTREELYGKLQVLPQYDRLFHASLDILEREGYTRREGNRLVVTSKMEEVAPLDSPDAVAARSQELSSAYPESKDYLPLLTTCQAAVLEVMAGRRDATDVIFPGGSMDLVAELYKGNIQTDFYNQLVADRVLEHVRHHVRRYKHSKVQLVEIGAGTGGTSTFVFEAIKEHAQRLRYLYTDIGSAFLQMSKHQFGSKYPFVEFMTLDVEKPPETQGFEPHTMDVVIASNVLHTTRRFDDTLKQCQRLLKPGGILVVNELTQRLDFNTLTFGLTAGWWLYEDEEERIQGAPLLRPVDWVRMLRRAGLHDIEIVGVPGVETAEQAQCMITAALRAGHHEPEVHRAPEPGAAPVEREQLAITANT